MLLLRGMGAKIILARVSAEFLRRSEGYIVAEMLGNVVLTRKESLNITLNKNDINSCGNVRVMKPTPAVVLIWGLLYTLKLRSNKWTLQVSEKKLIPHSSVPKKEAKKYRETDTVNELTLTEGQDMLSVSDEILTGNKSPSNNLPFAKWGKKKKSISRYEINPVVAQIHVHWSDFSLVYTLMYSKYRAGLRSC